MYDSGDAIGKVCHEIIYYESAGQQLENIKSPIGSSSFGIQEGGRRRPLDNLDGRPVRHSISRSYG